MNEISNKTAKAENIFVVRNRILWRICHTLYYSAIYHRRKLCCVAWLNNGAHLLWITAVLLLFISYIGQHNRLLGLFILPTIALVASYAPLYLPRQINPPENAQELSLLTYNINLAPLDYHVIADVIREHNADIVAVQELTPAAQVIFEETLSDLYPYTAFHASTFFDGQGVMSKYPIVSDDYWKIYLGHQRVEIDVNDTPVTLYNTHPIHHVLPFWGFDISRRTEEVTAMLGRAIQDTGIVLIAGDFNMTDQAGDYQRISQYFADSYREAGWGMGTTFPAHIPLLPSLARIDYVFHSENVTVDEARVGKDSGGSDHRPLLVKLALGGNENSPQNN